MVKVVFLLAASIASPTTSVPFHKGQPPWQGSQGVALASFPLVFLMRSLICAWMVTVSSLHVNTCLSRLECLSLSATACLSPCHPGEPFPTPAHDFLLLHPFHITLLPGFSKDVCSSWARGHSVCLGPPDRV